MSNVCRWCHQWRSERILWRRICQTLKISKWNLKTKMKISRNLRNRSNWRWGVLRLQIHCNFDLQPDILIYVLTLFIYLIFDYPIHVLTKVIYVYISRVLIPSIFQAKPTIFTTILQSLIASADMVTKNFKSCRSLIDLNKCVNFLTNSKKNWVNNKCGSVYLKRNCRMLVKTRMGRLRKYNANWMTQICKWSRRRSKLHSFLPTVHDNCPMNA